MDITEFLTYWQVIRKRLWLIALLFIATMAVILVTGLTSPPVYRATVKLQVVGSEPEQVSLFGNVRTTTTTDEIATVQNEFVSVLKNGLVAWRTIAELNLSASALDVLNRISIVREGDAIYVTAEADTPQGAESLVTTHVDKAIQYYREYRALPARVAREFLTAQLQEAGDRLAQAKDALLKFKLQNNLDSLERELNAYQDIVRALEAQRDAATVEEQKALAVAQSYRAEAQKAQAELDKLSETAASRAYYQEMIRRFLQLAAEQEAAAAGHRAARVELDQQIAQKESDLLALIGLREKYDQLNREVALAEQDYNFLLAKENEARLKEAAALQVGYIQVTEPARTPDAPAQSNLPRLAAVGGVTSLMVGIILAFVIEFIEGLSSALRRRGRTAVR
ncbi:MAG: hypothetical protein H5T60_05985 [Anaerolineae bacterium]|nr:hypothetical protein [Anaerolineae bacterium]